MGNSWRGFSDMPMKCRHPKREWYMEGTGHTTYGSHPPSRGTKRYFPTLSEALTARPSTTNFVTSCLAHYPILLNKFISAKLTLALRQRTSIPRRVPAMDGHGHQWEQRLGRERIGYSYHLRGRPAPASKTTRWYIWDEGSWATYYADRMQQ